MVLICGRRRALLENKQRRGKVVLKINFFLFEIKVRGGNSTLAERSSVLELRREIPFMCAILSDSCQTNLQIAYKYFGRTVNTACSELHPDLPSAHQL